VKGNKVIRNYEKGMDYSNSILYLTAEWCQPCKMLRPVLEKIDADFIRVDIDKEPELAGRFQVMSVPTMVQFVEGRSMNVVVGAKPKKVLEQAFGL